ncbi:hypothetical protein MOK15_14855 [Sphingobium sp. BYY-5]|uniref:hypothetical protein n=1 Tax=Sphingobium sp. BYY-5 TaxID=2926400 RepID=UPI001FA732F8|nr:hypothetical protein [Sphingobium sp. BYY-5]MCI4591365.1 hypothetical protein [Sphingobium sp. BYY-5]
MMAAMPLRMRIVLSAMLSVGVGVGIYSYWVDTPQWRALFWIMLSLSQIAIFSYELRHPPALAPVTATTDDFVRKIRQPRRASQLRIAGIVIFAFMLVANIYIFFSE